MNKDAIEAQAIGAVAKTFNDIRQEELQSILIELNSAKSFSLSAQDLNFAEALKRIDGIQKFIENPSGILGNEATKHGEIAEQVEVGITNARAVLNGLSDRATADPGIVGRTTNSPTDYIIDGNNIQSKYINSELKGLKHILEHLKKYEDIGFARGDGSYYHLPKDQFNNLMKILEDGSLDGRSGKSIDAIISGIHNIENESGQKFTDIVKAAQTDYKDVQWGRIQETIDNYRAEIINENKRIVGGIHKETENKTTHAISEHQPSWGEATQVAAIGAGVGAGLSLAVSIYKKHKEGTKISEFTAEDWQEIGLETGKKAARGGVTGYAVYGLTNLGNMSAPIASGVVSATIGMTSMVNDYRKGNMDFEDLIENSEILCIDTGMVTIGSMIGQTIIPIPVVGAVVGGVVSNIVLDLAKDVFNEKEMELLQEYRKRYERQLLELDEELRLQVEEIISKYQRLGGILAMAFDMEANYNIRFMWSRELAKEYGVKPEEILKDEKDIDKYFLN